MTGSGLTRGVCAIALTVLACSDSLAPTPAYVVGTWRLVEFNGDPIPGGTTVFLPDGSSTPGFFGDDIELEFAPDGTCRFRPNQQEEGPCTLSVDADAGTVRIVLSNGDVWSGTITGGAMELSDESGNDFTFERR